MLYKPTPILHVLFLFLLSLRMYGQITLEVVTRSVDKLIPVSETETIRISGENATIHIDRWDKNEVQVRLKLITKHRIRSVALSELENIRYVVEKKGKDLYLRNYFLASETGPTGCILKVEYDLLVPEKSAFVITNNLGDIELKNTQGPVQITAKLGNVSLFNIQGDISIDLGLGDLKAHKLSGTSFFKTNHAHIDFDDLGGRYTFRLTNSDLNFRPLHQIDLLDVETKNGNVICAVPDPDAYSCNFKTNYGEVTVPDEFRASLVKDKSAVLYKHTEARNTSRLQIISEFGNITFSK